MENNEVTEWTIKRLRDYLGMDCHTSDHVLDVLAQEIEAALATERAKVEELHKILGHKRTIIKEQAEKLAAEREARNSIESINKSLAQAVDQLREQAQTLVDVLKRIKGYVQSTTQALGEFSMEADVDALNLIDAVLEKIENK